jgi:hypothetical protein
MTRPLKSNLPYFPLDTDIDNDDKIALIEAKHGIIGFAIIIKLYKKIYGSNGYYYDWNEETQLLFSKSIGVDFDKVNDVVNDCIKWKLFDERIQKTYLDATYKRKDVEIIKEYLINCISDSINRDNVRINSIKDSKSTQSKVKESKVKESKVKHLNYIYLFDSEYKKLKEQLGELKTNEMIKKLDLYIGSKGDKYKSHYFTILNWIRMQEDNENNEEEKNLKSKAYKCYIQMNRGGCFSNYNANDETCQICHSERRNWQND